MFTLLHFIELKRWEGHQSNHRNVLITLGATPPHSAMTAKISVERDDSSASSMPRSFVSDTVNGDNRHAFVNES